MLAECPVNKSHGWGYVGKPRNLHLTPRYFSSASGGLGGRGEWRVGRAWRVEGWQGIAGGGLAGRGGWRVGRAWRVEGS